MKYTVKVKPGSSQEKIVSQGDLITIYIHARPHDGEANKAVVKLLAKHFKVAKSRISIIKGEKSREKVVEVL